MTIVEPHASLAESRLSVSAVRSTGVDLMRIIFCNPSAAAIDPPNGIYTYLVIGQ
jgi:hypothetical protein